MKDHIWTKQYYKYSIKRCLEGLQNCVTNKCLDLPSRSQDIYLAFEIYGLSPGAGIICSSSIDFKYF